MASSSSYNSLCAACKFLRRKCMPECIFAPYIPPEEPQKFANVHKIFGASNISKLLNGLLPHQREDAVYGCVGAISFLQRQVKRLQKELDAANADLICYTCNEMPTAMNTSHGVNQRNAYCNNDTGEILLQIDALEGGLDGDITGLRKQVGHLKHLKIVPDFAIGGKPKAFINKKAWISMLLDHFIILCSRFRCPDMTAPIEIFPESLP